ncbi:MAG: flagellar hook-basal body complex protein FliE [Vampirovibrio sp.]|nr:flagellar hook-basal body complex protein FliE [Vampirovibrio sp.]
MHNAYIPQLKLDISNTTASPGMIGQVQTTSPMKSTFHTAQDGSKGPSFKDVVVNNLQGLNNTLHKPDELLHQAITTGNVDPHQVMIANAKAELTINIAAQTATKVVQAYDRIVQIQV